MSIVRFTGAPSTQLRVDNITVEAGTVPLGGLFESSDEELAHIRGQFSLEDVDVSELSDAEKDAVLYLPEAAPEQAAAQAPPANPTPPAGNAGAGQSSQPSGGLGSTTSQGGDN